MPEGGERRRALSYPSVEHPPGEPEPLPLWKAALVVMFFVPPAVFLLMLFLRRSP